MRTARISVARVRATGNGLLERLSPADQALIEPHAELVVGEPGATLIGLGVPLQAVYFPGSALAVLGGSTMGGRGIEFALVGREGMLGWSSLLGAELSSHHVTVRARAGTLLRVPLAPLRRACSESPSLRETLLQFVHVMIEQLTRTIEAALGNSLDQRLARWLLMFHDRHGGDMLAVQHQEIAGSLNVRRASVTDRLHVLEGAKLIRCSRGCIIVRNRPGLEAHAGAAYGAAEAQYRLRIAEARAGGRSMSIR